MPQRHRAILAAYLLLVRNEELLFLRRCHTGYCDEQLGLPSGHVEEGESILQAVVREASEEIGLVLHPDHLDLVHVRDRNAEDGHRVDFFFVCDTWEGTVHNAEPHKCSELMWINPTQLPDDVIPYIQEVIQHIASGSLLSHEQWAHS